MKYKIVLGRYIDEQVNDMLAEGWELHGHPFEIGKGDAIAQAMVLNVGNPDFRSHAPGWVEPCKAEGDNDRQA